MKIKKKDTVLITSGKDKGKKGTVLRILVKENRLVVENVNLRKRHQKPKKSGEKGQIVAVSSPIALANVKLVCPKCGQGTRVGYKIVDKKKYRICKKCNSEI